jgi:hypothetical protein
MKKSKIIFLSLLGAIALLILAATVDVRLTGLKSGFSESSFDNEKLVLPSYKVLQINNSSNIDIVQGDSSYIMLTWLKDSLHPRINYLVKGDTLSVSDIEQFNGYLSVKLFSTGSLNKIMMNNSDISIGQFSSGKMSFDLKESKVWLSNNEKTGSSFRVLDIIAGNNSNVRTDEIKVDSMKIILKHSDADIRSLTKTISGTLSDSSNIYARQPDEISLKKDSTSKISVDDY